MALVSHSNPKMKSRDGVNSHFDLMGWSRNRANSHLSIVG